MDQTVTVPIYAIIFFSAIVLPWMLYLHKKTTINSEGIAIINNNNQHMNEDIKGILSRLDHSDARIEMILTKINEIYIELIKSQKP
jgi:hypothetical protein